MAGTSRGNLDHPATVESGPHSASPHAAGDLLHTLTGSVISDLQVRVAHLERELRESQREAHAAKELLGVAQGDVTKYREIFELAPDAYLITDPNVVIRKANWASAALLGTSLDKLPGTPLLLFVPASCRRHFRTQAAKLHNLVVLEPWETQIKPRGKAAIPVEIHLGAIRDSNGQLRGSHWIIRDASRRKEADIRVQASQRLSVIGEMIAGLAHESRNALQRSQACISMLAVELKDQPEPLALVERLRNAQRDLNRLYDEVRQYAAPAIVQRELCDLRSLLDETFANLMAVHPDRQARLVHVDPGHVNKQASVDSFAIAQVFRNILENALAACDDELLVTATWREVWADDRHRLVELRIRDNGRGLSEEACERIFQPFFTTKNQGTGLGMAIAKRIVEVHQGTICVGDTSLQGAELVVTLPRSAK